MMREITHSDPMSIQRKGYVQLLGRMKTDIVIMGAYGEHRVGERRSLPAKQQYAARCVGKSAQPRWHGASYNEAGMLAQST